MNKKLEGLFGIKLGDVFEKKNFKVLKKELHHDLLHIDIDWPPTPNVFFKDYSLMCSPNDMTIESISAKNLSPLSFDGSFGLK